MPDGIGVGIFILSGVDTISRRKKRNDTLDTQIPLTAVGE